MAELLAHYTAADIAFSEILSKGEIKLSPLASMRDPHESTEWTMWYRGIGRNAPDEEWRTGLWDAGFMLNRHVKILSTTRDHPADAGDDRDARCWSHPRLWDQYADRYEGVCLLFDKRRLGEAIMEDTRNAIWRSEGEVTYGPLYHLTEADGTRFFHLRPVTPDRNHLDPDHLGLAIRELFERDVGAPGNPAEAPRRGHSGRVADWLLLRKLTDWETEQEYRYMIVDRSEKPIFIPIASSLRAVVLGSRFPEWQIEGAKAMGAREGIRVCRGHWHATGLALTDA